MKTNMMKKLMAMGLAGAMMAGLAACGGTSAGNDEPIGGGDQPAAGNDAAAAYKVGIVQYVDDASLNQIESNIETELDAKAAELNVTFDYADYTYNGQADATTLNQIASELVADEVDVIVAIATPTAQVMQAATEEAGIPIIFAASSNPVGAGLVADMEKPGANITGTSDALDTHAILNLMLAADPDTDYVGLLYSKSEDSSTQPIADAKAYLDEKGIRYVEKTGTNTDEVSSAVDALIAEGVDAIFTPTDNTVMKAELAIYEKLAEAGIPQYGGADSFALNGAFCGYGVDYAYLGVATADMVVDVLVNGADPAETPVQTFENGIATVNTEICAAIGLDLDTIKTAFEPLCTQIVEITTAQEFED